MKKIIHIDMDCFYAAVEIKDNPSLVDKPVAVGGSVMSQGVLTTCNYIAREYGLYSSMPTSKAFQLCPELNLLPVNMQKYRHESRLIHQILHKYTHIIEPISLDEAYLDVSESSIYSGSATMLAKKIRIEIYMKTQLTSSAGIAPNKFLAKVASDWHKPNGQFTISPSNVADFIKKLPVKKIPGVGKVTEKKLKSINITYCHELQKLPILVLHNLFGSYGEKLFYYARGIDHRAVEAARTKKSLSVEDTYVNYISNFKDYREPIKKLWSRLNTRLADHRDKSIHKQFIKIKFSDFSKQTKECVVDRLQEDIFLQLIYEVLLEISNKKIRLLGIGVRFYDKCDNQQQLCIDF